RPKRKKKRNRSNLLSQISRPRRKKITKTIRSHPGGFFVLKNHPHQKTKIKHISDCQSRTLPLACRPTEKWTDGRVVECARLESVCTSNSTEGSNPSLSATLLKPCESTTCR